MNSLILLRHGESVYNAEKRFTGRQDVQLTSRGEAQARAAGRLLAEQNLSPDLVFSSTLQRAYLTAEFALESMARKPEVCRFDALCERSYGALEGFNKDEMRVKYGAEQVRAWRLDFDCPPPDGESLKDVLNRVSKFYAENVEPALKEGKDVMLVAHEHPLRAMLIILGEYTPETINNAELSTGVPVVFEFEKGDKTRNYALTQA